jgi:hypothetical protein
MEVKMKRKVWIAVSLALVIGLIGAAGVASAEGDGTDNQGPWRHGIVVELYQDALLLKTQRGEITVEVDDGTRFRIPGVEEPGLDDLVEGDHIGVAGRWENDQIILARLIIRLPGREELGQVLGELSAIGDDWMELTRRDGTAVDVAIMENTRFRIPGVEDPGLDDLVIGDSIYSRGLWNKEGILQARLVWRIPDGVQAGLFGKVTGVEAPIIEVQTRQGPDNIITDENTRFFVLGLENPTLADIEVDDLIVAGGVREEDGLHALVVAVTPERPQRAIRRGTVLAKTGDSFTLESPNGDQITIETDERTRFRVAGVEQADIDDIQVGFKAVAAGFLNPENDMLEARIVGARPPRAEFDPD